MTLTIVRATSFVLIVCCLQYNNFTRTKNPRYDDENFGAFEEPWKLMSVSLYSPSFYFMIHIVGPYNYIGLIWSLVTMVKMSNFGFLFGFSLMRHAFHVIIPKAKLKSFGIFITDKNSLFIDMPQSQNTQGHCTIFTFMYNMRYFIGTT